MILKATPCAALLLLSACATSYNNTASHYPSDPHTRLELRIAEARETLAAADRELAAADSPTNPAPFPAESWSDRIDECRWELDRRAESIRDLAARLNEPDPAIDRILASLDRARADLAAVTRNHPDNPTSNPTFNTVAMTRDKDRARASLAQALQLSEGRPLPEDPATPLAHAPTAAPQ